MIATKPRLLLAINRDDCDKTPTFASDKSRWLRHVFIYTYLRIATPGLRRQSGRKERQKVSKTQKFRESQLALKNKILSFARFQKLSFTSTFRNVTIWRALDNLDLGQPFKYLEPYHITRENVFRATWSWKMPQILFSEPTETFEISEFWSVFEAFFNFKCL